MGLSPSLHPRPMAPWSFWPASSQMFLNDFFYSLLSLSQLLHMKCWQKTSQPTPLQVATQVTFHLSLLREVVTFKTWGGEAFYLIIRELQVPCWKCQKIQKTTTHTHVHTQGEKNSITLKLKLLTTNILVCILSICFLCK